MITGGAMENVSKQMDRAVPGDVMRVIRRLAALAEGCGLKAYLVGGFVRDLLLGVENLDLDLTVEGDAIEFAGYAAGRMKAFFLAHKKFGTAVLILKKPVKGVRFKIDMASARTETYKSPGALPDVRFGPIRRDLYRRDFTINAMAIGLNKHNFGELVDFFGSREDLKRRRIRVLHDRSFIDDPTRIFRAVRFAERYNFKIDRHTESLIKDAVRKKMPSRVSAERIRNEIELILKEKRPLGAVKKMRGLRELEFISPKIRFGRAGERTCGNIEKTRGGRDYFAAPPDMRLVYFMAVIDNLRLEDALKACLRLKMRRADIKKIISCKRYGKKAAAALCRRRPARPSALYEALKPLSDEALLFLAAKCGRTRAKKRLSDFLKKYKDAGLAIGGGDLRRLGVRPGPRFKEILKKTLRAKIDGLIRTKKDELGFAARLAKRDA